MRPPIDLRLRCPFCDTAISQRKPVGQPYVCPTCSEKLHLSKEDDNRIFTLSLIVSFALCFLLGKRSWSLIGWTFLALVPVWVALMGISLKLFPPGLEPYDGKRTF